MPFTTLIPMARETIPTPKKIATRKSFAIDSNRAFVDAYLGAGGDNGVFNFPEGIHSWGYAGQQLQQMKPDIQRVLEVGPVAQR